MHACMLLLLGPDSGYLHIYGPDDVLSQVHGRLLWVLHIPATKQHRVLRIAALLDSKRKAGTDCVIQSAHRQPRQSSTSE